MKAIFTEQFTKFLTEATKDQLDRFIRYDMSPMGYYTATESLLKWTTSLHGTSISHDNFRYIPVRLFNDEGVLMVVNAESLIGFYALKTESKVKVRWRLLHALFNIREQQGVKILLPALAEEREVTIGLSKHYVAASEVELWTILTELGVRVGDHVPPEEFPVLISLRPKISEPTAAMFPYVLTSWRSLDKIAYDMRQAEEVHIEQK